MFLQGPGGSFFNDLSATLDRSGHTTSRINVCAGDWLLWKQNNAYNFRGKFADWSAFLEDYLAKHGVTDIVLFSDSRPYHRVAKQVAEKRNINLFAFENGYLRPDWITLELGGVNGNSCFPRTRAGVEAATAPPVPNHKPIRRPSRLALFRDDIVFHFANTLLMPLFPRHRRHRQTLPVVEAIGWVKKGIVWGFKRRSSLKTVQDLFDNGRRFFLYALQLEHDFQLIEHSPFASIKQASERVIASFAERAPSDCVLLVKNHPLDNEVVDRRKEVMQIAAKHGVADRVLFIDTGPNPEILDKAAGMVTVNSTMGTSALLHGLPVCTLGKAVYDVEGLTHQLGLDTFWEHPTAPDRSLYRHFRQALIAACQIHGRFVTRNGKQEAVLASADVISRTPYRDAGGVLVDPAATERLQAVDALGEGDVQKARDVRPAA